MRPQCSNTGRLLVYALYPFSGAGFVGKSRIFAAALGALLAKVRKKRRKIIICSDATRKRACLDTQMVLSCSRLTNGRQSIVFESHLGESLLMVLLHRGSSSAIIPKSTPAAWYCIGASEVLVRKAEQPLVSEVAVFRAG